MKPKFSLIESARRGQPHGPREEHKALQFYPISSLMSSGNQLLLLLLDHLRNLPRPLPHCPAHAPRPQLGQPERLSGAQCAQTHQRGGRVSSSPPLPSCPSCPRLCLQVALDVPWMDIQPTDMNLLLLGTPHHPGHRADRSRHGLHPPGAHCPAVVMEKKSTIQSTDDNPCVPDASLGTGGTEMNRTASSSCPQGAVF